MKKISLKNLSKTQTIIITVVITLLLVIILPLGIYSAVNSESPAQAVKDVFTPDSKQIIGKWQDDKSISGYEFYEDGTYDYYLSSYPVSKDYKINGNEISLIDYNTGATVIYKFSVNGNKLKLTLIESNGKEPEDKETHVFHSVDNFNLKKPIDIIAEFAEEAIAEDEEKDKEEAADSEETETEAETEAEAEENAD